MGSKRAGIREIMEPISDVLGLPMKIGISGQVSGKGKGAYPVLGDMTSLEMRIFSSLLDLSNEVGGVSVKLGYGDLHFLALHEAQYDTVQFWILDRAVAFEDEKFWSRKKLYTDLAKAAKRLWQGNTQEAEFVWHEIDKPAERCQHYLDLRAEKDMVSSEALEEAFPI